MVFRVFTSSNAALRGPKVGASIVAKIVVPDPEYIVPHTYMYIHTYITYVHAAKVPQDDIKVFTWCPNREKCSLGQTGICNGGHPNGVEA